MKGKHYLSHCIRQALHDPNSVFYNPINPEEGTE